jgi:hypothetical protein
MSDIKEGSPNLNEVDFALFFRLVKQVSDDSLLTRLKGARDINTPAGHRDFSIVFDREPQFCFGGYTKGTSIYTGNVYRLKGSQDPRLSPYSPTHAIALKQDGEDPGNRRLLQFAVDLCELLQEPVADIGEKLIEKLVLYNRRDNSVKTV